MQVLDTHTIVLDGTHLIEASAGTGKTYTITTLVLRLLAEGALSIESICVVTFTEAATAELRDRIRSRIKEALDVLRKAGDIEDPLLQSYAALPAEDCRRCCSRLQQALSCFDEAAIYTIHGFCRRLLSDFAYESGVQFETELITAQEQIVQESVDDFWRCKAADASLLLSNYLMSSNITPDTLSPLAHQVLGNPLMRIVPDAAPVETSAAEENYIRAFHAAARQWKVQQGSLETLLLDSDGLNRNKYRQKSIPVWCKELDTFFAMSDPLGMPPESLVKFTASAITQGCRKNGSVPEHSFFAEAQMFWEVAEGLGVLYEQHILYLKAELCRCIRQDVSRRKHEQNVVFFDDLLLRVRETLAGPSGEVFARQVHARFRAALIDEFQDTDQLQYEIFNTIFGHGKASLFFIGDPKQAIYSFRSADVFTYLGAASDVASQHTLTTNWRSSPELIQALEVLFKGHASPFVLDAIPFIPVQPSKGQQKTLKRSGCKAIPLQLCILECGKQSGKKSTIGKPAAAYGICSDIAVEIALLLDGHTTLADKQLEAGTIAVLVRTHHQARMVQAALRLQGIACVVQNSGNLFATSEASDLALILAGIAAPEQPRLVRSALATQLLGFSAAQLYEMDDADAQWALELERFSTLNKTWHAHGFSAMMRRLLFDYEVLPRLISQPGGERRVTNVLHLAEVLQEHSTQTGQLMWGLQRWFARQLSGEQETKDEFLLRLESDRRAVHIMTMHKSKGLEFDIVFCPFCWNGSEVQGSEFEYHAEDKVRALDLGSGQLDEHHRQAETEALAENIRLLYVALTRARNRCYLYWGGFRDAGSSALAYLLHNRSAAEDSGLEGMKKKFTSLSDEDILRTAEQLSAQAPGCIQVRCVQSADIDRPQSVGQAEVQELCCKSFIGSMHMPWRITSFSGFISGRVHEAEIQTRDSDNHVDDSVSTAPSSAVISLPPGANTGTMLHAVLENCTFPRSRDKGLDALIEDTLAEYQFDREWCDTVAGMVCRTATQPLPGIDGSFCLADLDKRARVPELSFHLPLKRIAPQNLQDLFTGYAIQTVPGSFADSLGHLAFSPVHGFLKGFIDSVVQHGERFYLIDWKSNLLGADPADYHRERLGAVMARDYYVLQYHLYALALHAYLEHRVPQYSYDENFGGVFYVFLRGLQPDGNPDYGVFYDRPDHTFVQKMARALIDSGADHAH